jgi:hypothetical protein
MTCAAVPLIARELSSKENWRAIRGERRQRGRMLEHIVATDDDGLKLFAIGTPDASAAPAFSPHACRSQATLL